mgnify:CR=1 FL=1
MPRLAASIASALLAVILLIRTVLGDVADLATLEALPIVLHAAAILAVIPVTTPILMASLIPELPALVNAVTSYMPGLAALVAFLAVELGTSTAVGAVAGVVPLFPAHEALYTFMVPSVFLAAILGEVPRLPAPMADDIAEVVVASL